MAAVKIASLFAEIGFKVDTAKVQQLTRLLNTLRIGLNRVGAAANAANYAASGASRAQIDAHRVATAAANRQAAQYRALAAQHAASAAAARAAASQARSQGTGGRARISTSGISAGAMLPMGIGSIVSLATVAALGKSFFDTNLQIDKFNAGLLVSTGSAKAAAAQYQWLEKLSDKLGTNFQQSQQQFMMFSSTSSALGFDGTQIRNMYQEIAKGQSALGMSADDAEGMTRALTQMLSKGKVMSEELKGQLAERVPGAVAIMAKAVIKGTGSVEEKIPKLFKMMEEGALDSKSAVWAFLQEMNSTDGMKLAAEAQAKSMRGAQNRFMNAWTKMMVAFGNSGLKEIVVELFNVATKFVTFITTDFVPAFTDILTKAKELAVDFAKVIEKMWELRDVALLVAVSLGIVAAAFFVISRGGIYGLLGTLITRMWAFAASAWASAAPMLLFAGVFLIAALAVGALLLVIQDIWSYFDGGSSFIGQAAEEGEYWARVLMVIADAFIYLKDLLAGEWSFPEPPAWLLKMIDFVSSGIDVGASTYNGAVNALSNGMTNTADFIGGMMPNLGGYSQALPQVGGRGASSNSVGVQGNVIINQQLPAGAAAEQYGQATSDAIFASAMGNVGQTQ